MNGEARENELDRILAGEDALVPSNGFLEAVMARVREESAVPAPIPFPWRRMLPGAVALAGSCGWTAWKMLPGFVAAVRAGWQSGAFSVPAGLDWSKPNVALGLAAALALSIWYIGQRLTGQE